MERDNWNNRNRYSNDRNQNRGNEHRADEDSYRGAYRLDTSSDHRNVSTWNGFDRGEENRNQDSDYNRNYNNDYNRNYNNDYNRNYNSGQQGNRGGSTAGNFDYDRDNRYQYQDRGDNTRNWDEQYQSTSGGYNSRFGGNQGGNSGGYDRENRHDSVRSRIDKRDNSGWGNFNSDYSPDNYAGRRSGANEGNMAGSLSFGYDGDRNSDPDWNRHYDPLSGERRSYHGDYQSRQQDRSQYRGSTSRNRNAENDSGWY
ncbi:hypothetical protein DXT99_02225 [Pontibacter diazotrophicus]|uniref:Uncharacterized protein n=1 Tax=Pontibacter diazotrophicus TaxID=1400979 RepID=A0A3D8LGR3_9BACT|nr:hypothetical protein [Pontibacter diazotrophicus]RDV16621.1 hypothetical protein DXT99_02225 [Pontibacter diazotrophicus]